MKRTFVFAPLALLAIVAASARAGGPQAEADDRNPTPIDFETYSVLPGGNPHASALMAFSTPTGAKAAPQSIDLTAKHTGTVLVVPLPAAAPAGLWMLGFLAIAGLSRRFKKLLR